MKEVKQSSTARNLMFLMVDATDHITGKTGLSPTVTLSKNGGGFASPSGAVTEVANGWYKVAGNATDSNTLGSLVLHATGTGADPADAEFEVVAFDPQDAIHLGLSALPNTACTTNASLLTSGTGTDQLSVAAGKVLLQATQAGVTIPTVTAVTGQLTAAQIATGVWQDSTSGDFTVASSIGKALYVSNIAPGAAGGHFIAGSNATTTVNITGSLSGSVGSVTGNVGGSIVGNVNGSVGSVVNNVGGNVLGYVAYAGYVAGDVNGSVVGDVGGNVSGSVGSVVGDVVGNLIGDVNGNVNGSVGLVNGDVGGNLTGSVLGNVDGSVGSLSGVLFPGNFGDLYIEATSGKVTLTDTANAALAAVLEATNTLQLMLERARKLYP